jgi:hypothetical protein
MLQVFGLISYEYPTLIGFEHMHLLLLHTSSRIRISYETENNAIPLLGRA